MDRLDAAPRRTSARQLGAALLLFALGVAITCVRFPPADLTGWIAQSASIPLGVPFLLAAALFGGSAWALRGSGSRFRVLRVLSVVAAVACAVTGVATLASFV
jgi:hypothetical protein